MKKYLNIVANSRPASSQSMHTRPTSSMSAVPPKRVDPYPRPATSLAHHRTASSSSLAPGGAASKLTRSQTDGAIPPSNGPTAPGPSSKRKDDMPPPAIIPHHRPQGLEPTAPPERLLPPVRQETKGPERPERPAEAPSSRSTTTQVQRPDPAQRPAHVPKPQTGPLRAEPTSIRERLLGRGQRMPLPEPKPEPQPAPAARPLPTQEKQAEAPKRSVHDTFLAYSLLKPCRSRVDSVRHGPKASAIMAAKRAITQVAAASSQSSGQASAQSIPEKKGRPTEGKKVDSKPPAAAGARTGISRTQGKKEIPRTGPAVSDRPKPSTSTRPTGKAGPEPRAQKEQPKAEKKDKPSQSSKSATTVPPKKVVARTGGVTQPTLSQLARMKAAEEEKGRRADAKGPTKPLAIRRKCKTAPPLKVTPNETEIPAATPLPPSPEVQPVDVPLPESPVSAPLPLAVQEEEQVVVPSEAKDTEDAAAVPVEEDPLTPTPTPAVPASHPFGVALATKTPISALVHSIQRGFLFSPNSPLSPAQPDASWEYPAWPGPAGVVLSVGGEEPSFEGVEESTIKRPLMVVGTDIERRALTEMNTS